MRRIPTVAFLLGAACALGVARADYHACLEYNARYYDLLATPSLTTLDRYDGANLVDRQHYSPFTVPAAGTTTWDEGVAFAATMQTRNAWLNSEQTSSATFAVDGASTTWTWYTTVNGVPNQFEFTSGKCRGAPATTTAAPQPPATTGAPNCLAWAGASGVTCTADEDCCGAGTMFPQCIPKNSGKQCCTHFKGAATCNASQTCCGAYGPGASSSAFCCNEGSTCCHASSSTQGSSCCPSGTTCCAGASIGLCCAADEVCEPNMNRCSKAATTSTAPTAAPSPALVGFHACISHNGWHYDIKGDSTFTQLDRFQGTTFADRNTYAPFHLPAAGTSAWDEGVAFAATMQTRNVWLSSEQTTAATWVQNAAGDTMTFSVAGAQFVFTTSNCV